MSRAKRLIYRLRITACLCLSVSFLTLAVDADDKPVSLEKAREIGREKSRYLSSIDQTKNKSESIPKARIAYFKDSVLPLLQKSCVSCHGPKNAEGDLRIDKLNPDLLTGADVQWWREVYNVISNSEMPPEDENEFALKDSDRSLITDWLSEELNNASVFRRHQSEFSSFRRMTKYEYNYALQDLLGIKNDFAKTLPPESASEEGFKNSSDRLQMSAMQFESYREIALKALKRAIVGQDRPQAVTYSISMKEEMAKVTPGNKTKTFDRNDKEYDKHKNRLHFLETTTGKGITFRNISPVHRVETAGLPEPSDSPTVLVLPRSSQLKMNLDRYLPDEGTMRVSVLVSRSNMNNDEYASLRLEFSAHTSNDARFSEVISEKDYPVTAPADQPQWIHFDIQLADIQRNPFRKLDTPFPRRDEFLTIHNVSSGMSSKDPLRVLIEQIQITAPFYDQWPPKTHTDIFFDSSNSKSEQTYGREVLDRFLRRIWHRTVTKQDVDPFMVLLDKYRSEFESFEAAMIEVLATALVTPEFLYLTQRNPGDAPNANSKIDDFELARRLSFFLWSSMPDDELLGSAETGKLSKTVVLDEQVERMLKDPRSQRFSKHFVRQWLGIEGLDNADHIKDVELKKAMAEEPVSFFNNLLDSNGSVLEFLHADYVMVNERLARHYRIPGVFGPHFRKVGITPQTNRGGVFTSAAILAMNSDGHDSHPIKRGVWMLERILQDPPPAPPADVPEVDLTDPEILKMSLKERIADHRNKPACISCHARIDPWGIAFENYDAQGNFRTSHNNKKIDSTSVLFNKEKLVGMDGLKRYLLMNRQDQFARALVSKMTSYALGRPLSFSDHSELESMTRQFRKKGDRLGDLVKLIVNSKLFQAK